jgi:hypothetical protein
MHRNMFHPTNKALIELIKRSKLEDLDEDGKKNLQEISARCKTCQFMGPKPLCSRRVIPEEADKLVFDEEPSIDLMWIEGNLVLHVVDVATNFWQQRISTRTVPTTARASTEFGAPSLTAG